MKTENRKIKNDIEIISKLTTNGMFTGNVIGCQKWRYSNIHERQR